MTTPGTVEISEETLETVGAALHDCVILITEMSKYVGKMALPDYKLFNEAPIDANAAIDLLSDALKGTG